MDNFILEIPNAIPNHLCDEIISRFEKDSRKSPGVINIDDEWLCIPDMKESIAIKISVYKDWEDVDLKINKILNDSLLKYFKFLKHGMCVEKQSMHPIAPYASYEDSYTLPSVSDSGYVVNKIVSGGSYKWHHDSALGTFEFATVIMYLNTLDYDEGGITEFINGRKIKPDIGKILIFPSTWTFTHRGQEVKSKVGKYTITSSITLLNKM